MHVSYILVATGAMTLPKLNIALDGRTKAEAINAATAAAKAMDAAGYIKFELYDDADHLGTVSVTRPAPVSTFTQARG